MMMKTFKQALVVFFKEMKCLMRDTKTFVFGIFLPLILVPSMLFIIDFSMKGTQNKLADNVNIAISNKNNSFYTFCSAQDILTIVDVVDPQKSLDSGEISAYVTIDEDIDEKVIENRNYNFDIKYSDSSVNSMMCIPIVKQYENSYKYVLENYKFDSVENLNKAFDTKIDFSEETQFPQIDTSSLYFNILVPMMLILYCSMGSTGTAIELSSGEKERGTFEPLLSTCANRSGIILGKLFATTAMGVASGLCTALGLCGYLLVSSSSSKLNVSIPGMLLLLLIIILTSMFFSSINLLIGMYSKSSKEAQIYLMPMSLISLIPTFFTFAMDISQITYTHLSIPVYNIICIIKEILAGIVNFAHIGITASWLILYVSVSLLFTLKLFKKENILFRF